jgi:hypothetical protein
LANAPAETEVDELLCKPNLVLVPMPNVVSKVRQAGRRAHVRPEVRSLPLEHFVQEVQASKHPLENYPIEIVEARQDGRVHPTPECDGHILAHVQTRRDDDRRNPGCHRPIESQGPAAIDLFDDNPWDYRAALTANPLKQPHEVLPQKCCGARPGRPPFWFGARRYLHRAILILRDADCQKAEQQLLAHRGFAVH